MICLYLFLDAIYLKAHGWDHGNDAVLCAYGITRTGKKALLRLQIGEKESYLAWHGFPLNLVDRGLAEPILVASDGAAGLKKALREVYPKAIHQRCKVPGPEYFSEPKRRRFTAEYKLNVVRQADACGLGELGALKEGLYFSNLTCWRRQTDEGQLAALSSRRGRKKGWTGAPGSLSWSGKTSAFGSG